MTTDPPPPRPRSRRAALSICCLLLALTLHAPAALTLAGIAVGARLALGLARAAVARGRARGLRRAGAASDPSGRARADADVCLGVDTRGEALLIPDGALGAHAVVFGASGAGKTTTMLVILRRQIAVGRPVVVVDLKGSPALAHELSLAAAACGRRFQRWTPDGGSRWNPLAAGNATELKDKLIATERFTEPHYQRAAERYVQTAIQVLQESAPDGEVTLHAVVQALAPECLALHLRALAPQRREYVQQYLASMGGDQLSAVRGFASRLAILTESHTGRFLAPGAEEETIDLRRVLTGSTGAGEVVLFSLNSSTYGRLSAQLGTLIVQDLVSAAGERLSAGASGRACVAIDEFSALGSDNVVALLARGREAGVAVILATQELADLDRAGRGVRDQILGNAAVKLAHRQDLPDSATTISRLAGSTRVWERSFQARTTPLGGADMRRSNLRLVERPRVDADTVMRLGTGELLAVVKWPTASARVGRVLAPAPPAGARPSRHPPAPGVTR